MRAVSMPTVVCVALLLGAAITSRSHAQSPAAEPAVDSGTLVVSQNGTEILRERFIRRATALEGEMTTGAGQRASYTATLLPDGRVSRFEAREYAANAAAPAQVATVTFRGDSVRVEASANGTPATATIPARAGALPYLNPSPALMGQIVRRARALRSGADRVEVPLFILGMGGQAVAATVTFGEASRATLVVAGISADLDVDPAGNVRSGNIEAQGITIRRAREFD